MKLRDVLVFKSPSRINWGETRRRIVLAVIDSNPYSTTSEVVMMSVAKEEEVRKMVHRYRVSAWYGTVMAVDQVDGKPNFERVQK